MDLAAQIASVISAVTGIAILTVTIREARKGRDDEDRPGGKHRKP